ncbi:MAG: thioredoxin domain-containing protein [Acidobacteria bacterium]|nr:thioredoxin domain-containing protein [Acidobacteriota bacterium]
MKLKKIFAITLVALGLLIAPPTPFAQAPKQTPKPPTKFEPPKVLGVLFYADWCGSCKALEPKLDQVKRGFQGQPILFTRFDLTDDFTNDQSARYAALLGLENYYRENAGKTGYMLLIDAQSKKLLGKITKLNSPEEIKTMLTQTLAGRASGD